MQILKNQLKCIVYTAVLDTASPHFRRHYRRCSAEHQGASLTVGGSGSHLASCQE